MLTMTKARKRVDVVSYSREFRWKDRPTAGFGFTCNEYGAVDVGAMWPAGQENYRACMNGTHAVNNLGVQRHTSSYIQPGEGRCKCGRTVVLDGDMSGEGIDCECGRIYNSAGQELAPREQWSEL